MTARTSSILRWSGLALLGLVIAVAVGVAAAKLTSQQIGLSSEPLRAGNALAPKPKHDSGGGNPSDGKGGDDSSTTTSTTTSPTTTTTPTSNNPPATPPDGSDDSNGVPDSDDD